MNFLDKFISFVDPKAAKRRARDRAIEGIILQHSARGYDGAATGRRTGGWTTSSTSSNTELQGSLISLRNRARDMVRNDPFAARAVQAFAGNLIGTGITPTPKHKTDSRAKAAAKLWKDWAESTECDFNRRLNMYGLQALAARTIFESGEVLIRRYRAQSTDKLTVPLQLQVLEPDYLDAMRNNLTTQDGGYILQGVEYDKDNRIVAYWLFKRHPGDIGLPLGGLVSERVLASEIRHVFRQDRPGQNRGATWFAPILLRLRDFNEYDDAQLMRQKVAACYAVFMMNADPTSADLPPPTVAKQEDSRIEPGMILNVPDGKDVKFAQPPGVEGYSEFSRGVLRAIAAGLNIPYEILTGDLSQVNFSSARMGWLEFHRNLQQWTWGMFIPQFCDPIWNWFIEAARIENPKVDDVPAEWTPPRREMINPSEEIKAAVSAIRAGLSSRSDFIRSQGNDPDQVTAEIKADNDAADAAGLILDSDPRKMSQVGQLQIQPGTGKSADAPASDDPKGEAA